MCGTSHAQSNGYAGFLLGLRNPALNKVAEAIDAKNWAEAHRVYGENSASMISLSGGDLEIIKVLVAHAINENSSSFGGCVAFFDTSNVDKFGLTIPDKWPAAKAALMNAEHAFASLENYPVVKRPDVVFEARDRCDAARSQFVAKAVANAPNVFVNHFPGNLADLQASYPVAIEISAFSTGLVQEITKQSIDQTSFEKMKRLASIISQHATSDSKRAFARRYVNVRLRDDSAARAADLEKTVAESLTLFGLALADIDEPADIGIDVRTVLTTADANLLPRLAFRSIVPTIKNLSVLTPSAKWVVVINPLSWSTSRDVKDKQQPKGKFLADTRRVPNPAYAAAQIRFNDADFQLKRAQIDASRLTGWAAVGGAFIVAGYASNRESAYRNLMATPESLEEPVFKDYEFSTNKVAVRRKLDAELFLFDVSRGEVGRLPISFEDSSEFALAYGIHDKDKDTVRTNFVAEADVDAYEKVPIRVSVERLLSGWSAGAHVSFSGDLTGVRMSVFQARQTPAQQAAIAASVAQNSDLRFDSVVVVRTPKGSGTGFFVAPNLVLTNQHVVDGSQFAEVRLRDGKETFGKVVRMDVNADLALIETAQAGKPVEFAVNPLKAGDTVDLIGHPRGMEFTLTRGVISAVRPISNPVIRGGNQVLMIQTDAAMNTGNSGGPMFLGNKVVGVNTQKLRDGAGLGFAVHVSEVIRFMSTSD